MKRKRTNRPSQKKQRSVRLEQLQDRKLMAADYGMFYGPVEPQNIDMPAAQVSQATAGQNNNAYEGQTIYATWSRGNLYIIGSAQFDHVNIRNESSNVLLLTATTTNEDGDIVGSAELRYTASSINKIVFDGYDGDDVFVNSTMIEVEARGGEGDDNLRTNGRGYMWGGEGNDRLSGRYRAVYLWGEDGNDKLFGSRQSDYLHGGNDNDEIFARRGNDQLYGGSGNDRLKGEAGDDTFYAGSGNDTLYGGADDDTMYGESGTNWMYGGDDNDTMIGGTNRDVMYGQDGHDTMLGQQGNDYLSGGEGNDKLGGGSGNDTLSGNDGFDELFGHGGYDFLFGGDDRDLLDGGDDGLQDTVMGQGGDDIFVRHKAATFLGTDDPDHFNDYEAGVDEVFNDYLSPNYGYDFPVDVK